MKEDANNDATPAPPNLTLPCSLAPPLSHAQIYAGESMRVRVYETRYMSVWKCIFHIHMYIYNTQESLWECWRKMPTTTQTYTIALLHSIPLHRFVSLSLSLSLSHTHRNVCESARGCTPTHSNSYTLSLSLAHTYTHVHTRACLRVLDWRKMPTTTHTHPFSLLLSLAMSLYHQRIRTYTHMHIHTHTNTQERLRECWRRMPTRT